MDRRQIDLQILAAACREPPGVFPVGRMPSTECIDDIRIKRRQRIDAAASGVLELQPVQCVLEDAPFARGLVAKGTATLFNGL